MLPVSMYLLAGCIAPQNFMESKEKYNEFNEETDVLHYGYHGFAAV